MAFLPISTEQAYKLFAEIVHVRPDLTETFYHALHQETGDEFEALLQEHFPLHADRDGIRVPRLWSFEYEANDLIADLASSIRDQRREAANANHR